MLIQLIIQAFETILNALFSWLPQITTLPTIGGFDIDSALTQGVAELYAYASYVWVVGDMMLGLLGLLTYYIIKNLIVRFFLGHRAPQ